MLKTRVIPCLLLMNNGLVKTTKFRGPVYIGDPINAVKIFNEKEVDEIILLDITATECRRGPNFQLISDIASECFMPLAYGGGIKSLSDIKKVIDIGVEKVIINSSAIESPLFIREAAGLYGSQSIIISIDVKKKFSGAYEVFSHRGRNGTDLDPAQHAVRMEEEGAGEIFLNSIDKDGTREGYDIELIKRVSSAISIPLIACGGAGSLSDFKEAVKAGASAVAAGSFFVFYGKYKAVLINYPSIGEVEEIFK